MCPPKRQSLKAMREGIKIRRGKRNEKEAPRKAMRASKRWSASGAIVENQAFIYIFFFYLVSLTGACILMCCLLTCYWRFDTARVHCTFFISWVSCFSFFFSIKKKNAVIMLRTLSFLYLRSQSRDSHQDESFFFFLFRLLSPSFSFSFFTLLVNPESTFLFFLLFQIARCVLFWVFFFFSVSLRFRKLFSKLIYTDGGKNRNKKLRCSV